MAEQESPFDRILSDPAFAANIVHRRVVPAAEGRYSPFPEDLDERLAASLRRRGIERLYTHQAAVWNIARSGEDRRGRHVVVVTPTASGKTLCYNLPTLQALLEDPSARALYLFPTKALSQDQQAELDELVSGERPASLAGDGAADPAGPFGGGAGSAIAAGCGPMRGAGTRPRAATGGRVPGAPGSGLRPERRTLPIRVCTYDGDTPDSLRTSARDSGRIVVTNPDMLHAGILPNHPKWVKFFSSLRYVVVDEAHVYRGIFGSHVANVIRRLKRICAFYGSKPTFILCSATIGNPEELAGTLVGEAVELVDDNGAPRGEKRVVLYNPPLLDSVQGIRRSVMTESQRWALAFLRAGVKTILFAHSRVRTEVIASYINEALKNIYTDNYGVRVEAYRGGLLPLERREIERGLRDGTVRGVVSTNALELGIDIGGLDAAVVAGFPGSFNSFWQQSGRAGRRGGTSIAVFVASSSPLDQYVVRNPDWFFAAPSEEARLDPDNPYVLSDHVKCAAFELPFRSGEEFGAGTREVLDFLVEGGVLREASGKWYWADRSYPSEGVGLRTATADNVVIVDATKGRNAVIGEMDRPSAKELLFENAVYIHRGRQYLVKFLDIENRRCVVEEADVNYFTDALVKTDIKTLSEDEAFSYPAVAAAGPRPDVSAPNPDGTAVPPGTAGGGTRPGTGAPDRAGQDAAGPASVPRSFVAEGRLADVLVRSQAAKFKKIRFHTHENVGYGEIELPEEELQTRALALLFPPDSAGGAILAEFDEALAAASLWGLASLIQRLAPMYLLCDRRDLGVAERVRDPHFSVPAIYVYDRYPGGTGLAESLAHRAPELFSAAYEAARLCTCESGCPSCVGVELAEFPGLPEGAGPSVAKRAALRLLATLASSSSPSP